MFGDQFNLALAVYAGAIGWASMAFFGIDTRFIDQHSRIWLVFHRLFSALGGVLGGWVFTRLPFENSLAALVIAAFSGAFVVCDLYTLATGRALTPGPWTPGPWGRAPIGRPPIDQGVFDERPDRPDRPMEEEPRTPTNRE